MKTNHLRCTSNIIKDFTKQLLQRKPKNKRYKKNIISQPKNNEEANYHNQSSEESAATKYLQ